MDSIYNDVKSTAQSYINSGQCDCAREVVSRSIEDCAPASHSLSGEEINEIIVSMEEKLPCEMEFIPGEQDQVNILICSNMTEFCNDRFSGVQNILTQGEL